MKTERILSTAGSAAALMACGLIALPASAGEALPPDIAQMLAQVRNATASYHDRRKAEADGYVDIDLFIPGMGFHYLNFGLLDGTFDPLRPEVMVYAPNPANGRLRLVAVEYLVPCGPCTTPPEGFPGDLDGWVVVGGNLWALHAWVWYPNPDGTFAAFNPRVN